MNAELIWDDSDPTASVAVRGGSRYVVWPDGTLSGHGKTEYFDSVKSAKAAAQTHYQQQIVGVSDGLPSM